MIPSGPRVRQWFVGRRGEMRYFWPAIVSVMLVLLAGSVACGQGHVEKSFWPTREVACAHCGHAVTTSNNAWPILRLGFAGQGAFAMRFLAQWLASERAGASVIPELFWWLSLSGGLLMLFYGWAILAGPIIVGQGLNCLVYGRNLVFVRSVLAMFAAPGASLGTRRRRSPFSHSVFV